MESVHAVGRGCRVPHSAMERCQRVGRRLDDVFSFLCSASLLYEQV